MLSLLKNATETAVQKHSWWSTPLRWVSSLSRSLFDMLLLDRLFHLYLNGPRFSGWGFWGGLAQEDICCEISHVEARFWAAHPTECEYLIMRRFDSFYLLWELGMYLLILYKTASILLGAALAGLRLLCGRRKENHSMRKRKRGQQHERPSINTRPIKRNKA